MKAFFRRLGEMWSIIGIMLLLLLIVELSFRIYLSFKPMTDERALADCYGGQDWVPAYYEELHACGRYHWETYACWRRDPFDGEFIRVDGQGYRATVTRTHPLSQKQDPVTIFFLGGSSVWGTGVRDAYTIPSLTGNALIRNGMNPAVVNMGESGYVSSQDLQHLMMELKKGNIPDVAVFYGGLSDILSSYRSDRAGIPQNESQRALEFNAARDKKKSVLVLIDSFRTLATVRFFAGKFGGTDPIPKKDGISGHEILAESTVHHYNETIRLVNALAKEYGFQALFYWQPSVFDKAFRTGYEEGELERAAPIQPLLEEVSGMLFTEDLVYEHIHFFNLSGLFAPVREPIFIDWCHTGEAGNLMISEKIAADLLPVLDSLNLTRHEADE